MAGRDDICTNWCIDNYKNHYDSEEQWKLKRDLLRKHQKTIPEEKLICLVQCLVNMEVLGCRYPIEVKQRIEEFGGDILKKFRELRKNRNKRVFVSAEDAAANYVQRPKSGGSKDESLPMAKKGRIEFVKAKDPFQGKFGRIVLYCGSENGGQLLQDTSIKCGIPHKVDVKKQGDLQVVSHFLNNIFVAKGESDKLPDAKTLAKDNAAEELRKHYYMIKLKVPFLADPAEIPQEELVEKILDPGQFKPIGENNFGFKMLQSLGWTPGTALREKSQVNPVVIGGLSTRAGLGMDTDKFDPNELHRCKEMVQNYAQKPTFYDLVFSPDMNKELRAKVHKYAESLGLQSKSYNREFDNEKKRQLVISRKIKLLQIAAEMLSGTLPEDDALFQKYELIPPTTQ